MGWWVLVLPIAVASQSVCTWHGRLTNDPKTGLALSSWCPTPRPELILPHKIHAAISMKGWDGFSTLVAANIAQRTKGQVF